MHHCVYRFRFEEQTPMSAVRDSLFLAALCAEGMRGRTVLRLDAIFRLDEKARRGVIDASRPVGQTIARIFTELLIRQFGDEAFKVERVAEEDPAAAERPM